MYYLIDVETNKRRISSESYEKILNHKKDLDQFPEHYNTVIKQFNYIVSEYDIWMSTWSQILMGIFTDFDLAMKAVKKEYKLFEESDEYILENKQMTPVNNHNNIMIGIKEVELNILEEV